jgi:hypothetical protein
VRPSLLFSGPRESGSDATPAPVPTDEDILQLRGIGERDVRVTDRRPVLPRHDPGVSLSCPLTIASATAADAQGTFTQSGSTVSLAVPGQPAGTYSGILQYTITN